MEPKNIQLTRASQVRVPQQRPADDLLLGRYRVLERCGTGGFGAVCTCWDTRLQRRVAIKRMPLAAGTTTAAEALAEARTSCMLEHPNIVAVHDFESDGTYAYLVMEFVDGLNLAELLQRVEGGTLTYEECAHVLASIADALSFAHENRVLHLDIKPTNIMIDRKGTVKLADFGMASLASAAGYGDARGGTVGYMPPEQIEGKLVDERADIFALAVVIWQALTGSDPFLAPNAAASEKLIVRGPARPLSRDCPELAGNPEEALLEALAPSVAERTPQVEDLASGVLPFLGSQSSGRASLGALVSQSEEDEAENPVRTTWTGPDLPIHLRAPWLEPALERIVSALVTLAAAWVFLHAEGLGLSKAAATLAPAAMAAVAAAWPPAGSGLAVGSLVAAIVSTSPTAATFPLAMAIAAATALWWVLAGRTEHLGSAALLLPVVMPSNLAAAGLAGFALDPGPAALTGFAGYLLGSVAKTAVDLGFSALPCATALAEAWTEPTFWLLAAVSAAAAAASSAIALRGSVRAGIAGQVVAAALLAAGRVVAYQMENTRILTDSPWADVLVAVTLCGVLCIATTLRGPLFEDQEGDGIDEFSE